MTYFNFKNLPFKYTVAQIKFIAFPPETYIFSYFFCIYAFQHCTKKSSPLIFSLSIAKNFVTICIGGTNMALKYEEIADTIRKRIKENIYPPNTFLPNQLAFSKEFQASRMTVKKAITILAMEGLVYSQRGAGTKVLNPAFWNKNTSPMDEYYGLTQQMQKENKKIVSKIISFEIKFPDLVIQERLLLSPQQPVYEIKRLRIVEDLPFVLEHTYMPSELVPGLSNEILAQSIYTYMKDTLHLHLGGAYRQIQAAKSDQLDQKYLACTANDPVLEVEQVVYLKDGRPVEYSRSRNKYDVRGYSILDVEA